jgi:hypothetical protein
MNSSLSTDLVIYISNIPAWNLTPGTNIFDGLLPENAKNAIMIMPSPSNSPHEYINTESILIDFWTMYDHTPDGYDMIKQIYSLFHRKENYTLDNWYIYSSLISGNIIDSDRTAEGSKLYKLSVLFTCRPLADVS